MALKGKAKFLVLYFGTRRYFFLVDTGASLSVIKRDALPSNSTIIRDETTINGIAGQIQSSGFIETYLTHRDDQCFADFNIKLYVFNNIPLKADGILGLDFLCHYASNINLKTNIITLSKYGAEYSLKLLDSIDYSSEMLCIPARSESIHYLLLNNLSNINDCVIHSKQLAENVFLAGCIGRIKNNRLPIKILNTNEYDVQLPMFQPEIYSIEDYNLCNFECNSNSLERAKLLLNILKLNDLNSEERKSIQDLCSKYSDVFFLPGDKLTTTNIYEQSITLKPNTSPVYVKQYRLPHSLKNEVNKQIQKMIDSDIIEEAKSEWSSPILLVPKKSENDKKWRLVVDYRKLNDCIVDDKFPLPNITEILDSLSGSIYFSHLDLNQGYYQVALDEKSREYTAFTTNTGQYQMKRLPMGLKTSPSAFSRVMSVAMSGLTYDKCFVYLDDLVVFGRNLDVHNRNLIDVLERLRKVNLKLNPEKCKFLKKDILYLGHLVSENGVLPDPAKVEILQKYPVPTNTDEVKRFVAFCNYYRKFIKNFAEITYPLNKLTRKYETFIWTNECQKAFETLKHSLITPPVLEFPDFSDDNEFVIQTDASGTAIGAVLCNKNMKPVAYASRPLNKAELNYPTIQKELVAIVWAVKYFRPYVYGKSFTIMSDHRPLIYLFSMKDPSSRLLKFRLALEEYNFKIVYVKGKDNSVADALSRISVTSDTLKQMNDDIMLVMTRAQKRRLELDNQLNQNTPSTSSNGDDPWPDQPQVVEVLKVPNNSVEMTFIENNELNKLKRHNDVDAETECFIYSKQRKTIFINLNFKTHFTRAEFVTKLGEFCKSININELCIVRKKEYESFIKDVLQEIKSNKDWTGPRIYVVKGVKRIDSEEERKYILHDFHLLPTAGHAGVRRMTNNIKRKFYWPGLDNDVKEFVRKCIKCQKMKHCRYVKAPMEITTTASHAFEKVYLDVVGPLDKDIEGNRYILTLQCELTKFVEAYPLKTKETVSIAQSFVSNFILRYSVPNTIATDRGTEFVSSVMEQVCKLLGINKLTSTSYHHQSIGALENTHKNLGAFLRIQSNGQKDTWSQWLPFWCYSFNNTVHTETKYTPFELVFGRPSIIPSRISQYIEPLYNPENYPLDLKYRLQVAHKDARNNLLLSKHKRKQTYDKSMNNISYVNGQLILVKNETCSKLDPQWDGPYVVSEDLGVNVKILRNNKDYLIHKNRTKPFIT